MAAVALVERIAEVVEGILKTNNADCTDALELSAYLRDAIGAHRAQKGGGNG
jgi:hypothetical protein